MTEPGGLLGLLARLVTFDGTWGYLHQSFVQTALIAAVILGLITGLLTPLIVSRGMAFAVHGTAELSFTGASAALLAGVSVSAGAVAGALVAAFLFGLLGLRHRERDSVIGVILAFGLGLGVLLLSLYQGRSANKFGLLTGSIVSVDSTNIVVLSCCALVVLCVLAILYRPLLFASTDPEVAAARGVSPKLTSIIFALLIGLASALAVPVVGAILVLALMITPGASAIRISSTPLTVAILSICFAEFSLVGGTILSLAPGLPPSGYVTSLAFVCYVASRVVSYLKVRQASR
jgi:zinc/manganese transport system permease protein